MCKKLVFLISVVLVLSLAGHALAQDPNALIRATATPPVIDGIKDDVYSVSAEHKIDNNSVEGPPTSDADLSASWWALWDTEYLYLFYDVNDDELYDDSAGASADYQDDTAEIFIDFGNDDQTSYGQDDYQYFIPWHSDPNVQDINPSQGARSIEGVEFILVEKDTHDGYTVEIKFPWTTLDYLNRGGVSVGTEIGIEAQIDDDDDGDSRDRAMSWWNTDNVAWQDPSTFGPARLTAGLTAFDPHPHNGELGVNKGLLQWSPGMYTAINLVYFDTSQTKVENRTGCDVNGVSTTDAFYAVSIATDTTYYWAIDEVNESGPSPYEWAGNVWTFTTAPAKASQPSPENGAELVAIDEDLSWAPGFFANQHKVYLDASQTNVQNRSGCQVNGAVCTDPCYILPKFDTLVTYYWAVDEVNETGPDPCLWPGDIWSFTTVPVEGLGSILFEMWGDISGSFITDLTENVRYPDRPDYSMNAPIFEDPIHLDQEYGTRMHGWLYVWDTDYYTFWIAANESGELWLSTDDNPDNEVLICYTTDWDGASREWDRVPEQQSNPIYLQGGRTYYIKSLHKAEYNPNPVAVGWSTTPDPATAEVIEGRRYLVPYLQTSSFRPVPRDGATDVESTPTLEWSTGIYAVTHDIYFGTDRDAVSDANRTSPLGVLVRQDIPSVAPETTYDITADPNVGLLDFSTTYYWRIDDINVYTWKGRTWTFTTGNYHVVEDFEDYEDTDDLDDVWHAHSTVNVASDLICDYTHNDSQQAMAIGYDNTLSCSEAYADTDDIDNIVGSNWRLQDTKALSLWVRGIPDLRGSYTGTDPYTLEGDGEGIHSTTYDNFYYLYSTTTVTSSEQVTARIDNVESEDEENAAAMAGVMLRDTTNVNSVFMAVVVTQDDRVMQIGRGSTGSTSSTITTLTDVSVPHWVRVQRVAVGGPPNIYVYHANDVNDEPDKWTQLGSALPWPMNSPFYLGAIVTASNHGEICTAEISNLELQAPANPVTILPDPVLEAEVGNYTYNDPEEMYVFLQATDSNGIVYYGDETVTQSGDWIEWRMDLKDFIDQGVDACDVQTMYVGVGDKDTPSSGEGTVLIDDIRLYGAEFYAPECPPFKGDLARDGDINYGDLEILTDNWLIADYDVTPVAPHIAPLSRYQLNNDACDTGTPGGHDGNEVSGPTYTTDRVEGSHAIDLDGTNDYVDTDANAVTFGIDGNNPKTITAWVKTRGFNGGGIYELGENEEGQDFSLRTMEDPNQWRMQNWGGPSDYGSDEWDTDFTYPSLDTWVHFAQVYDGTTTYTYVDGYAVAAARRVVDLNTTDEKSFKIGRWSGADEDLYFDGIIDDVHVYNYALTQAEAASLAGKTTTFTQPIYLLLTPSDPEINLYDGEHPEAIDLRDLAVLGENWGNTQIWPTW